MKASMQKDWGGLQVLPPTNGFEAASPSHVYCSSPTDFLRRRGVCVLCPLTPGLETSSLSPPEALTLQVSILLQPQTCSKQKRGPRTYSKHSPFRTIDFRVRSLDFASMSRNATQSDKAPLCMSSVKCWWWWWRWWS